MKLERKQQNVFEHASSNNITNGNAHAIEQAVIEKSGKADLNDDRVSCT